METFFTFTQLAASLLLFWFSYAHWQQGKKIAWLKSDLWREKEFYISERKERQSAERKFCHHIDAASDLLEGIKNAISDYELNTKPDAEETP